MGFNNPVSNAVGVLVRQLLKSVNFVAGLSGWQITRAGDAEFNSGTFRGNLTIGTAPNQIILGQSIPALVANYYAAGGPNGQIGTVRGVELFEQNSQTFVYMALVTPNAGRPFLAVGGVESVGLVLSENFRITPGTIGALAFASWWGPLRIETGTNGIADLIIDGKSYGRGLIGFVSSNLSGLATVAEQQSLGIVATIKNGRAYEIRCSGQVLGSVANQAAFITIRRTNTAGPVLLITGTDAVFTTVADHYEMSVIVINNSGGDITDNVLQDISRAAGAGTVQQFAAVGQPTWMWIRDIGSQADYSGAIQF